MTPVSSHVLKAIAEERIADLHSNASARPEPARRGKRRRRHAREEKPVQTLPVMRPEQR
jgi:hypothetical protein